MNNVSKCRHLTEVLSWREFGELYRQARSDILDPECHVMFYDAKKEPPFSELLINPVAADFDAGIADGSIELKGVSERAASEIKAKLTAKRVSLLD